MSLCVWTVSRLEGKVLPQPGQLRFEKHKAALMLLGQGVLRPRCLFFPFGQESGGVRLAAGQAEFPPFLWRMKMDDCSGEWV